MIKAAANLVFIPGFAFDANVWQDIAKHYPSSLLLDLPAIDPKQSTIDSLNTIVQHMAQQIANSAIVIAWSLGGLIAIKLAYDFPSKVRKLVLVGSNARFLADTDWLGVEQSKADYFYQNVQSDMQKLYRKFVLSILYPDHSNQHKAYLTKHLADSESQLNSLLKYLTILYQTDLRQEYDAITIPIMHLVGSEDAVVTNSAIQQHQNHPTTTIQVISGAGHAPFITHTNIFLAHLNEFI